MSNAASAPIPPAPPSAAATAAVQSSSASPTEKATARRGPREVILRKHYNLFYWWIVWAYAGFAALVTAAFGSNVKMVDTEAFKAVTLGAIDSKTVKVFTEPWLAIGFVATLLFVSVFTAVRAKGAMAMVLLLALFSGALVVSWTLSWTWVFQQFPFLRLYMNQGVYVAVFTVLCPAWVLTTFLLNRLHYLRFRPGRQVADVRPFGGGEIAIASHALSLHKLPEDIFVHRILGLWWLGFGTADIEVAYTRPDGSAYREVFENVVHPTRKINAIQAMLR
jgi:hypothetical protein